jgi:hypothetical protein
MARNHNLQSEQCLVWVELDLVSKLDLDWNCFFNQNMTLNLVSEYGSSVKLIIFKMITGKLQN